MRVQGDLSPRFPVSVEIILEALLVCLVSSMLQNQTAHESTEVPISCQQNIEIEEISHPVSSTCESQSQKSFTAYQSRRQGRLERGN